MNLRITVITLALTAMSYCAWAQDVKYARTPINGFSDRVQICVGGDCHDFGTTPSNTPPDDAGAWFTAQAYATLVKLSGKMDGLVSQQSELLTKLYTASTNTNDLVAKQINSFNQDLRNSIDARFDKLPQDLAGSDVIKQLRADILKQVDDKLKAVKPPTPAAKQK